MAPHKYLMVAHLELDQAPTRPDQEPQVQQTRQPQLLRLQCLWMGNLGFPQVVA